MSHVRAQIREYVRALLATIPGLEDSVELDSSKIPKEVAAPFVYVTTGGETIEQQGLGGPAGRKNLRALDLLVDIYCRARLEALLAAEDFAAQIEAKLAASPRMGGLVSNTSLRAYVIENSDDGDQPVTRLRMQWAITYFTNERDATVPA